MLKKQEILLGKGTRAESSRVREPRRTALSHGFAVAGFMVMGLVSGLSLANHSDSKVLPGGVRIAQPRWMLARGILGSGQTCGVSFRPFPNSSGWWWLIPYSLSGSPVIKQLMQMVTVMPGQGGRFQSVASPNSSIT